MASPSPSVWNTAPLVAAEFSGCRASDLKDAKGKIVLSARGDCSFNDKVTAADQVGAAGLVIFDDDHYYMGGVMAELLRGAEKSCRRGPRRLNTTVRSAQCSRPKARRSA